MPARKKRQFPTYKARTADAILTERNPAKPELMMIIVDASTFAA